MAKIEVIWPHICSLHHGWVLKPWNVLGMYECIMDYIRNVWLYYGCIDVLWMYCCITNVWMYYESMAVLRMYDCIMDVLWMYRYIMNVLLYYECMDVLWMYDCIVNAWKGS